MRSRRNGGEDSAGLELIGDLDVENSAGGVGLENGFDVSRPLGIGSGLVGLLLLLWVQLDVVVLEVPLSEGVGIDGDNGILHESLGSHKLVVGGIVDDVEDSGLASDGLGSP